MIKIPKNMDQRLRLRLLMVMHDINCIEVSEFLGVTHQRVREWVSLRHFNLPAMEIVDELEFTLKKLGEVA